MIQRSIKRISMRALMVDDELGVASAEGRAARALVQELQGRAIEVIEATSAEDGISVVDLRLGNPRRAARLEPRRGRASRARPQLPAVRALT